MSLHCKILTSWVNGLQVGLRTYPGGRGKEELRMSSGTRVAVRKKLLLSLLVPIFLVGWAVVPMSEAGVDADFSMSANGTAYFVIKNTGLVGNPAHVTTLGLGAS